MDRKPKFRSRKIDYTKAIAVYRWDQLGSDQMEELESPIRSIQPMATGVDKEEEDEHHLQAALSAQAAATSQAERYYIPTPESKLVGADYDSMYPPVYKMPKAMIRYSNTLEDVYSNHNFVDFTSNIKASSSSSAAPHRQIHQQQQQPQAFYNADEEDLLFLKNNIPTISVELWEQIVDCLEDSVRQFNNENIVTLDCLERFHNSTGPDSGRGVGGPDEVSLERALDWWKVRRAKLGRSLVPFLRHEDMGKLGADPYVCFRRREVRLPRKTRRSDAQCMERLRKLQYDLSTLRSILVAAQKRDRFKRESLALDGAIWDRYWEVEELRRAKRISEWPSTIPPYKSAVNCLISSSSLSATSFGHTTNALSVALKESMDSLATAKSSNRKRKHSSSSTRGPGKASKLSIPISALRSLKYAKPYYPIEMLRQMHADMEKFMTRDENSPGEQLDVDQIDFDLTDEPEDNDLFVRLYRNSSRRPAFAEVGRFRMGRGGRIMLDCYRPGGASNPKFLLSRTPEMDEGPCSHLFQHDPHASLASLKLLGSRDMFHLHASSVGNYNQHYIQVTNQISRPLSFNAWMTATGPIVQSATSNPSGGTIGGAGSGEANSASSTKKASPKKKKAASSSTATSNPTNVGEDGKTPSSSLPSTPTKRKATQATSSSTTEGVPAALPTISSNGGNGISGTHPNGGMAADSSNGPQITVVKVTKSSRTSLDNANNGSGTQSAAGACSSASNPNNVSVPTSSSPNAGGASSLSSSRKNARFTPTGLAEEDSSGGMEGLLKPVPAPIYSATSAATATTRSLRHHNNHANRQ